MSRKSYDQELLKRTLLGPMTAQEISTIMGGYGSASDHVADLRRRRGWTVRVVGELPREEGQRGRSLRLFKITTPLNRVKGAYCCGYCEIMRIEKNEEKEKMKNYSFECRDNPLHLFILSPEPKAQQEEVRPVMECPFVGCTEFSELRDQKVIAQMDASKPQTLVNL